MLIRKGRTYTIMNVAVVVSEELRKQYYDDADIYELLFNKDKKYYTFDEDSLKSYKAGYFLRIYKKLNIHEIICPEGKELVHYADPKKIKFKDTDRVYVAECDIVLSE